MKKRGSVMLLVPTMAYGGSQRAACSISRLIEDACELYLVTFNGKGCTFTYGGSFVDLKLPSAKNRISKIVRYIQRIIALRRIVNRCQIDMIISFTGVANQYVSRILGNKCSGFISSRGYEDMLKNEALIVKQVKRCNGVIFNSEDSRQYFIRRHPELTAKCISIPNCFDIEQLRRDSQTDVDDAYRDFCKGNRVIVAVGRLCKVKGFATLIKAFLLLRNRMQNVKLAIIGDGEDMLLLSQLADKSPDIMLTGAKDNPMPYLKMADVFVLPSRHEGFPNVVVEAMSVGLPVICTNCRSGPNEILNKAYEANRRISRVTLCDYGILVPAFDEPGETVDVQNGEHKFLADAMEMLLSDAELSERYRKASLDRTDDFSYETSKERYLSLISNVLNENG